MFNHNTVQDSRARSLRFAARVYRLRILGTVLCILPIASVLSENQIASPLIYIGLFTNGVIWAHVAYYTSSRAKDPARSEFRNLVIDSGLGGFWLAIIGFSPAPTAILVTILTIDKITAGGWWLVKRATLALLVTGAITWCLLGFPFYPALTTQTFIACVPLLFMYCVSLSYFSYRQAHKIARQNKELERLNRTDINIELPNRRFFETRAAEALEHHRHSGQMYSLLLIDIDRFKMINDGYGHSKGDEVLSQVAEILRTTCRAHDTPARYGGDEFAVLLMHADLVRAAAIGERIRQKVGQLVFEDAEDLVCSTSIGVTQISPEYETPGQWVAAADIALYRAKAAGRDRVMCQESLSIDDRQGKLIA